MVIPESESIEKGVLAAGVAFMAKNRKAVWPIMTPASDFGTCNQPTCDATLDEEPTTLLY
jgi:hypothetical protein